MATEKKTKNKQIEYWLKQKLRRLSYQWPARKNALKKARVSRGNYECAICKEDPETSRYYGPKEINMDHIVPVIDIIDGFVDWNTYIERLFCDEDGWQVLCHSHHDIKTEIENVVRRDSKVTKKATVKSKKRTKKK